MDKQDEKLKVYVASSWRCERQPGVVEALRAAGHEVYDFRHPEPGDTGFSWRQVTDDRSWLSDPERFREGLRHPVARRAFKLDMGALRWCDACVLVLPCGRSAHLEAGWAAGAGKATIVLLDDPVSEPELMWLACDRICVSVGEVIEALALMREPHRTCGSCNQSIVVMVDGILSRHNIPGTTASADPSVRAGARAQGLTKAELCVAECWSRFMVARDGLIPDDMEGLAEDIRSTASCLAEDPDDEDRELLLYALVALWRERSTQRLCDRCGRRIPVGHGAADDMPDACDACWANDHAGDEAECEVSAVVLPPDTHGVTIKVVPR